MSKVDSPSAQAATPDNLSQFEADRPQYSVDDFLRYYGKSRPTFWRELKAGKIPHCRLGRAIRFSERNIGDYLASINRDAITTKAA